MPDQEHVIPREIADWQAGALNAEGEARVRLHVEQCAECSARLESLRRFVEGINADWTRARLKKLGADHPTVSEIEALWMEDGSRVDLETIRRHVEACNVCFAHLNRLRDGLALLAAATPLSQPSWADRVNGPFAAAIEVFVEAGVGAYATAASLAREAMIPQAHARITPGGASPPHPARAGADITWRDAAFQTEDLSGEVAGGADPNTGRGIITTVIYKAGAFVGVTPIVDLVDADGRVVSTQVTLDMGDRYSARFSGLDEGQYLLGIREPSAEDAAST